MTERKISWDRLSAYVDGEIDAASAHEITSAAAIDADIAEAIATIAQLKAACGAAFASDPGDVPRIRVARPSRAWTRLAAGRSRALAASLLIATVLAGAMVWSLLRPDDSAEFWAAAAQAQHAQWLAASAERGAATGIGSAASDFAEVAIPGTVGYVPDLSVAQMRVAHISTGKPEDDGDLFVGYVGRNGCRLGLRIGTAPDALAEALTLGRSDDGRATATWSVGETGYAAVAHGMDEGRFRAVTHYLERVTRQAPYQRDPVRTATRIPDADAPCLG